MKNYKKTFINSFIHLFRNKKFYFCENSCGNYYFIIERDDFDDDDALHIIFLSDTLISKYKLGEITIFDMFKMDVVEKKYKGEIPENHLQNGTFCYSQNQKYVNDIKPTSFGFGSINPNEGCLYKGRVTFSFICKSNYCINEHHPDVIALIEKMNMNPIIARACISIWLDNNGSERFPTIKDMDDYAKEKEDRKKRKELYETDMSDALEQDFKNNVNFERHNDLEDYPRYGVADDEIETAFWNLD